uniref:Ras-like protein n=1 Tax=Hirondellea gigas TaxID=1518452 RepID=A0A6A7G5G3_9CRUS
MAERKRCTIFDNKNPSDGKVVLLPNHATMKTFLKLSSEKLGFTARRLFTENGAEIDDVLLIRDDDIVFVSRGEQFAATKTSELSVFQIAVMGPGAVGKSAMTLQYVQGVFVMDYDPTIEDAYRKPVEIDGHSCMLDILDTAGQEDYTALRSTWMRERDGFLLVFSVSDRSSFEALHPFHEQLEETHEDIMPPLILVGNKADTNPEDREVSISDAEALADQWDCYCYIETSAKTGQNIDRCFANLIRAIRKRKSGVGNQKPAPKPSWWTVCGIL